MTRSVTVIMPVRNEETHIRGAIESILANRLDDVELEILVVDGMSDDSTRDIVADLFTKDGRVKLFDNTAMTVPYAMNLGLAQARGDVIIRVDGHAQIAPDFIASCLEELEAHPECGCVGGAIESVNEGPVAAAISSAMSSPFGVGNALFRLGDFEGYVDTLAFGAYRREVFERVGRFDEVLTRNQDDEFNFRMQRAGYRIWMSPNIRSRYFVRSSFAKLFRQYYQYGYWKVYVNRKHGTVTNLRQLVPAAFVVSLAVLVVLAPFSSVAGLMLGLVLALYVLAGLMFGLRKTRSPAGLVRMLAAFGLLHVGYGLGYLEGIYRFYLLGSRPGVRNAELSR